MSFFKNGGGGGGSGVAQCTLRNPAPLAAHGFEVAEPQPAPIEVCAAVPSSNKPAVDHALAEQCPPWCNRLNSPMSPSCSFPQRSLLHDHSTLLQPGNCLWRNAFNYYRGVALLRFHQRSHAHLDVHVCNTVTCVDLYNCNHQQGTELSLTTKVDVTPL